MVDSIKSVTKLTADSIISPALASTIQLLTTHFEEIFKKTLSSYKDIPPLLSEAIQYVCLNGGKRVRACLVYLTGQTWQIDISYLDSIALAIEMIHAYSLTHDDLPAMDNDALRRGKPTCHIAYGEDMAILVGDALQCMAFQQLSQDRLLSPQQKVDLIQLLTHACGPQGIIGGQVLDIKATSQLTIEQLKFIHQLKTQALLSFCIKAVNVLSKDPLSSKSIALETFAEYLGLAYQVQDDILDVITPTEILGKPQGSDHANQKITFVSLLGLEHAQSYARELHQKALNSLSSFQADTQLLQAFTHYLFNRTY